MPVFDDDLDCIIGYQRSFARRCHLFDLNGEMLGVWEDTRELPPPEKRDSLLVVGGLWKANVRGMTALGLYGSGMALAPTTLARLRNRFARLAQAPLLFAEAAHGSMSDAQRFAPVHILRLAMRHGEQHSPPPGQSGVSRYLARLFVRRLSFTLELITADKDTTVVRFDYWRYADALPATCNGR